MTTVVSLLRSGFSSQVSAWAFVPVIPVHVFGYLDRGLPWRGDWLWTLDWAGSALFVIGALVATVCAVDTGRALSARRGWLVDTAPGQWRVVAAIVLPCLATVGLVHLLAVATYLGTTATSAGVGPPAAVLAMVAVQLLGLAFFAVLGAAAGLLVGPVLGPVAAAAVVLAASSGADFGTFVAVAFGSATASLVGFELSDRYYMLQAVVLAGLIGLGALVRTRQSVSGARIPTAGCAVAVAMSAALFVGPRWFGPDQRFVLSDSVRPEACVGQEVTVCFFTEHRPLAESVADDVDALYRVAADRGVADLLPDRVVETVQGVGDFAEADGLTVTPDEAESGHISTVRLAEELVTPDRCDQLRADAPPADEYWLMIESLIVYLTSLDDYVVSSGGFPSVAEYRAYAEQTGGGVAVPGIPLRELTVSEARQALERLQRCEF
jgi:hypothetical protein